MQLQTDQLYLQGPGQKMKAAKNRPERARNLSCASNSDTLFDSAVTVYLIHVDHEEEL